jgi:glycerophosphoryl diester phosphodiesterase
MSSIMGSHFPAVSAPGPRAGTIDAYVHALGTGAEYVEFDIRRTADGELAAFHDARVRQGDVLSAISYARLCDVAGYEVPRGADVMALIAGKAVGHLDLKDTGGEERVVDMALDLLGPGPLRGHHAGRRVGGRGQGPVPPGYSLGRDLAEVPRTRWAATRYGELWTVDDDAGIRRWLTDPRVTVLITNRPADAMAGRASLAAPA